VHSDDLSGHVTAILELVAERQVDDTGHYCRHSFDRWPGTERHPDAYGSAAAVGILWTTGHLPAGAAHQRHVDALRSYQREADGTFHDPDLSHHHTTAYCLGSLHLLQARSRHPLKFLAHLVEPTAVPGFLESLEWDEQPWSSSHVGAGAASALALAGMVDEVWWDVYFNWLDHEIDPHTGLWRAGRMGELSDEPGLFANLGGTFHYLFLYEHFLRRFPYPDQLIDSALSIHRDGGMPIAETEVGFVELDLVYCLARASQQTAHRADEVTATLDQLAADIVGLVSDPGYRQTQAFLDLHVAFGGLSAIAELQRALPGRIRTQTPLRLVLDRRPFI